MKNKLSVFDLDHTLLSSNSSFRFCVHLCRKGIVPLWAMLFFVWYRFGHSWGKLTTADVHNRVCHRFLRGIPLDSLEEEVEEFLDRTFNKLQYVPAVSRLHKAQQDNHYTLIISSSPSFLADPIARRFGVDECQATSYAYDSEKKVSHVARVVEGTVKADLLAVVSKKLGIIREEITSYSDSWLDLPLLEASGHAVGVNPDNILRKVCLLRQWDVI